MADEIKISVSMKRADPTNTLNQHQTGTVNVSVDQTTDRHVDLIKTVGTTEESIDFSTLDIGTNGYLFMHNLDSTNYVNWGTTSTDYPGKIRPGEPAGPFELTAGKTLFLKANTAACDVRVVMYAQ